MSRFSKLIWLAIFVVSAFMVYKVKYQVQGLKTQIAQTSRELENEKEALHVLGAEWAYLNRPDRLAALAAKYLAASDLMVNQVADIEAIPFPNQMQAEAENETLTPASMKMRKPAGAGQ
jgi:hypothetical protein